MGDFNYPGIERENMSTSGGRDAESFYEKMNDYPGVVLPAGPVARGQPKPYFGWPCWPAIILYKH